jgi:hypothetical protein
LGQVPLHPVDTAVDIGVRQSPRFANLPDQEESNGVASFAKTGQASLHPCLALVEIHQTPRLVLASGPRYRIDSGLVVYLWRTFNRHLVDWIHMA